MMNSKGYKAILFDFFDVIYADAFKRWLASRGLKREGSLQQASEDLDIGKIDALGFRKRLADITGQSTEQVIKQLESFHILNDEIIPLLDKLGKNYQLGLLSNASSDFLRGLLRKHDLEPKFHHIIISSEVGVVKPSPEIFEHILTKMNIAPEDSIFIDDNEKNIVAAAKMGIKGLVFTDVVTLRRDLDSLGVIT